MRSTELAAWAWIPIVMGAALAQTARNAAQRSLTAQAGTLGATLVRFLYGLPFAALWVAALQILPSTTAPVPGFGAAYFGWIALGAVAQIAATAFLLAAMKERNFVIAVTYSKTEVLQVAVFATLFLGELPGWVTLLGIMTATAGVVMLSLPARGAAGSGGGATPRGWGGRLALLGLASGAGFALSAIGYRGAALQLPGVAPWMAGAWGVMWAQALQSLLLGGWLAWRSPQVYAAVFRAWRVSTVAGAAGALASIGWFTAFALQPAAQVRALGMVEVLFSYVVSRRLLREGLGRLERAGLLLVAAGVVAVCTRL